MRAVEDDNSGNTPKLCPGALQGLFGVVDDVRQLQQRQRHSLHGAALEEDALPLNFCRAANVRFPINDEAEGVARKACRQLVDRNAQSLRVGRCRRFLVEFEDLPIEFTIAEFAEMVLRLSGSKSRIIRKPLPVDDPKKRRPDISLAKKILKWQPRVPLEQGLSETIDWFKQKGKV